jgi:cobalamin biosynthesis Mg chelatase CobN
MVWSENERKFLVLPRIDLGNVILLPQPARGPENDEKLLHDRELPPPLENAGISGELRTLDADINKFKTLENSILKEKYRQTISKTAKNAVLTSFSMKIRTILRKMTKKHDFFDQKPKFSLKMPF